MNQTWSADVIFSFLYQCTCAICTAVYAPWMLSEEKIHSRSGPHQVGAKLVVPTLVPGSRMEHIYIRRFQSWQQKYPSTSCVLGTFQLHPAVCAFRSCSGTPCLHSPLHATQLVLRSVLTAYDGWWARNGTLHLRMRSGGTLSMQQSHESLHLSDIPPLHGAPRPHGGNNAVQDLCKFLISICRHGIYCNSII
jgi:hypothetical protein